MLKMNVTARKTGILELIDDLKKYSERININNEFAAAEIELISRVKKLYEESIILNFIAGQEQYIAPVYDINPETPTPVMPSPMPPPENLVLPAGKEYVPKLVLGLNDKLLVINDLFGGSQEAFNDFFSLLNLSESKASSKELIIEEGRKRNWDNSGAPFELLVALNNSRFIK